MQEKTREEVSEEYKWDLSTVYKSDEELLLDYNDIKSRIELFKDTEKTFLESSDSLYNTLVEYYDIEMLLDKMWTFTSHRYDTDITNNANQSINEKIINLFENFSINSSFMIPTLLDFGFDKIKMFYDSKPELEKDYGFVLEDIFRNKPHTLSIEEEKLISSLSKAFSDTSKISSMLNDSDIDFGFIKDENGETVKLNDTNYSRFLLSKDRRVRKDAFETLYRSYKQFNNTFALALSAYVNKNEAISKVRKFNSSLEASLFDDNVSIQVYINLIDTVSKNLDVLYAYYNLKKEVLGLDEMHMYDTYLEISDSDSKKYTFDEAKDLVMSSLSVLGNDYINNLSRAFSERWIDIYPNKGKRGGAYSGGSYLTNPFLLLNFEGKYHDVSTLAHELGHSMHTYYSCKNNPYQYSEYQIFVAEVASQVNELLFNNYMLSKVETKEEKINILNQILELFKASIFRQTMFAEFEKEIADKNQNGEILTANVLNDTYYNLVCKYFGNDVFVDDEIKYEWSRIPHFYYNFYVYKYSTGLAAASYIAKGILEGKEGAIDNYLEFLKTGGSDYPLEELKIAGVDLTNPEVIQGAMDMFKSYLDELKELIK
ncbi:MAG: oligoendopeptidase F [Bacilli bacterium]|nr:oligoendopeptidase F [Bacilli bacterium]